LFALIVFLLFAALVLPRAAARAERINAGAGSPDTELLYSTRELLELAEAYGEDGRAAYVRTRFTFDLAFPIVYGLFLLTAISWFADRSPGWGSAVRRLNLVPIGAVLFDFAENIATSIVMLRYPEPAVVATSLAPIISFVKWILVSGSFVVLAALIGIWLVRIIRSTAGAGSST
jgi:hypothetical protein